MACRRASATLMRSALKHTPKQQIRQLSLHEYQSHSILRKHDIPVPRGWTAATPQEVRAIVESLGPGGSCSIQSQVSHGESSFINKDQGKIRVESPEHGEKMAIKILGDNLHGTHTEGNDASARQLYVSETVNYDEAWYLAMTIDRESYSPVIVMSKKGRLQAAEITKKDWKELFTFPFKISQGITPEILSQISGCLEASPQEMRHLEAILEGMYKIFDEKDGTLLEINPLARSSDGSLICVGANFEFDDAAAKRQSELFSLRDVANEVPEEVEAEKHGLVYVRMDGDIGNVVNGAGLAMGTNDAIGLYGGTSANFLDAGGQATKATMQEAFAIIMRDERVKAILVNIYGGITNCAMIAEAIIGAASELGPMRVPVVVRLQGTNSPEGLKLLEEANLGLHVEADFGAAAEKAVGLARSN